MLKALTSSEMNLPGLMRHSKCVNNYVSPRCMAASSIEDNVRVYSSVMLSLCTCRPRQKTSFLSAKMETMT